jgi:hypothetical protein
MFTHKSSPQISSKQMRSTACDITLLVASAGTPVDPAKATACQHYMAIGESGSSPDWPNTKRKTKRYKSTALRRNQDGFCIWPWRPAAPITVTF